MKHYIEENGIGNIITLTALVILGTASALVFCTAACGLVTGSYTTAALIFINFSIGTAIFSILKFNKIRKEMVE